MTYMYDGFRIIAKGLRALDRPVAVMGALASRFHEYAPPAYSTARSGFWNFAKEPMLDHLDAWEPNRPRQSPHDLGRWPVELHEYIADMGRLHIRYKTATWLCGLIPHPFMRAPMPKPLQQEIDTIYQLLKNVKLDVIEMKEARIAA